jgi:predicted nucleotidyltransferase
MNKIKGLTVEQYENVCSILKKHLSSNLSIKTYIFGSRAEGTHRVNSDLDILIEADKPINLSELSFLKESFENLSFPLV